MRTTVTLDDDLFERLRDDAHERGVSFKRAINEAVRAGIERRETPEPFEVVPFSMGKARIDLTKANQIAAAMEDEEILRKMAAGK